MQVDKRTDTKLGQLEGNKMAFLFLIHALLYFQSPYCMYADSDIHSFLSHKLSDPNTAGKPPLSSPLKLGYATINFNCKLRFRNSFHDYTSVKGEICELIIDVFNHFYPKEYLDAIPKPLTGAVAQISSTMRGITDMQYRLSQMDKFGIDMQILSLPNPTFDDLDVPNEALRNITRAANDGIARLVGQFPARFAGIATVSLTDVDVAIDELERSIKDLGLLGVQILSNARGRPLDSPEFEPFYSELSKLGGCLWVHPAYIRKTYDWMNDEYNLNMMMGWGIDTSLAMFRLFRSGVLERYPELKIIPHHLGALIPLMAGRISSFVMAQGKHGLPPAPLRKMPMEYMKMFYVDTAEGMWKPALVLAQGFFGSNHMLFGTDYPWGDAARIIANIKGLDIPEEEKRLILGENAINLLGINKTG